MKVAVVGAGVGGVVCAYFLAKAGVEVVVYEKKAFENVTYDWHDDISKTAFERAGIPNPPEEFYYDKRNWGFVAPFSTKHIYAPLEVATDVTIQRRPFLHWLISLAKEVNVTFEFGCAVELLVKDGKVCGVIQNGKEIAYDLVVDSCGVDSNIRAALPEAYNIQKHPQSGEVFSAYRAFFSKNDVTVKDEDTNLAYLLHNGQKGISWCIQDPREDCVDILIGRIDGVSDADIAEALNSLKEDNAGLGDRLLSGGKVCRIPVRYPLTKMVGDGYAALGDAAFMTIPMLGSGMASSMLAGRLLAEAVIKNQSTSVESLWEYQVNFYMQCGVDHYGIDVIKRWLLSAKPEDIKFLFESGVLSEKDINSGAGGSTLKLSLGDLIKKLIKGISRLPLLLELSGMLKKSEKAVKLAKAIPTAYDEAAVLEWQNRVDRFFAEL